MCSVNNGTLAKTRSASTPDVPKNVVSPERSLLPPVFESIFSKERGLYRTMHLIKSLIDAVNKLRRKGDNLQVNTSSSLIKLVQYNTSPGKLGHQSQPISSTLTKFGAECSRSVC